MQNIVAPLPIFTPPPHPQATVAPEMPPTSGDDAFTLTLNAAEVERWGCCQALQALLQRTEGPLTLPRPATTRSSLLSAPHPCPVQEYMALQQALAAALRSGFLSLAQARYSMGAERVSVLQLPSHMSATARLRVSGGCPASGGGGGTGAGCIHSPCCIAPSPNSLECPYCCRGGRAGAGNSRGRVGSRSLGRQQQQQRGRQRRCRRNSAARRGCQHHGSLALCGWRERGGAHAAAADSGAGERQPVGAVGSQVWMQRQRG